MSSPKVTEVFCLVADICMVKGGGVRSDQSSDESLACQYGRRVGPTVGREAEVCLDFFHVLDPCPRAV